MSRKNRDLKFNPKLAREQKFKEAGKFGRGGNGKGFGNKSRQGGNDFGGRSNGSGGFGGGNTKNRPGKMKRTNMRNKKFSKKGGK